MHTDPTTNTSPHPFPFSAGTKLAGCYVLQRDASLDPSFPVWLAQDEVLGKEVTLHFIPKAVIGDVRGMTELRQEVKRGRQLIHPGIVRVYDLVEDGDFVAISMDRIDGDSLNTIMMSRNRLDTEEVLPWIMQLAATLDDAHRVQLFHRDLAPSNLFVKPSGEIVIANFGISRCLRDSLERSRSISREDCHLSYMSPQQLDGDRPSKQDDVYGLGVLAFELLTGGAPFSGHEVVSAIRTANPPTISEARGGGVSEPWERFVANCMAKKPESRPASCAEAVALLSGSEGDAVQSGAAIVPLAPAAAQNMAAVEHATVHGGSFAAPNKGEETTLAAFSDPFTAAPDSKAPAAVESQLPPPPPPVPQKSSAGTLGISPNFPELERPGTRWQPAALVAILAGVVGYVVYTNSGDPADDPEAGNGGSGVQEVALNPGGSPDGTPTVGGGEKTDTPPLTPGDGTGETPVVNPPGKEPAPQVVSVGDPKPPVEAITPAATVIQPEPVAGEPPKPNVGPKPPVKKPLITVGSNPPPPKSGDEKLPVAPPAAVGPETPPQPPVKPTPEPAPVAVAPVGPVAVAPVLGPAVKLPVIPSVPAKVQIAPTASTAELEKLLTERVTAEAALKGAISEADRAQQELTKQAEIARKAQEAAKKNLDDRRKAVAPVIRENEALLNDLKKREEEFKKAEAAALEARKSADAAKLSLETMTKESAAKLEGAKKADEEVKALMQGIADIARQGEEVAKSQTQAVSIRQQAALGLQQVEKEKATLATALEKTRAAAAEAMRVKNQAAIAELAKRMQPIEAEIKKSTDILAQLKELGDAGEAASKPIMERVEAAKAQLKTLREEAAALGGGAGDIRIEKKTDSAKPAPKRADRAENSLGMKFVKVGDVEFSVYLVTRKDFDAFATDKGLKSGAWRSPGFAQDPDHPVVNVTWKEADAFCKWLSERERRSGAISADETYRLPTDMEWSIAVGLPPESGATPEERDLGVDGVFPWGGEWPPPVGAGNYAGEETNSEVRLEGYRDDHQWTSPVGKFKPNVFGLFDMGGNVWQWTADYSNGTKERRVLRGGSWYNGGMRQSLLASCRYASKPDEINDTYGFRVVRATVPAKAVTARN